MKGKDQRINLTAELVQRLVALLKSSASNERLGVQEKQIANSVLGLLQKEVNAAHKNSKVHLSKKLVRSVLKLLMGLLADDAKLKMLFDLFHGGK